MDSATPCTVSKQRLLQRTHRPLLLPRPTMAVHRPHWIRRIFHRRQPNRNPDQIEKFPKKTTTSLVRYAMKDGGADLCRGPRLTSSKRSPLFSTPSGISRQRTSTHAQQRPSSDPPSSTALRSSHSRGTTSTLKCSECTRWIDTSACPPRHSLGSPARLYPPESARFL